jgi:hypothetical protein
MFGGSGGCGMKAIGVSSLYVKTSFGISLMKKSRPVDGQSQHAITSTYRQDRIHTYYQAFHLILSLDFHAQRFCYLVMVFESTPASRHDAQVFRLRAIVVFLVDLEFAHELYACVYPVRLEFEEVQSTTNRVVAGFAREVYEFCEGAPYL